MRLESMSPLQLLSRWKLIQDGIMSCVLFAKRRFIQLKKTLVMKRAQSCLIVYYTADELAEEVAEDGDSVLPNTLNDLMGKILLFKMDVTSKNLKSTTFIVEWFKPNQYDKLLFISYWKRMLSRKAMPNKNMKQQKKLGSSAKQPKLCSLELTSKEEEGAPYTASYYFTPLCFVFSALFKKFLEYENWWLMRRESST
ncbi:hypothetical protein HID58_001642 [Brassica napus]|uniref:Uncharacterized protein n=1 Tax=Brassica napus TaxID=3708 RepID=A0ABQ8EJY9_BRANA|nr:hypothetical protein HID58_001642 [Brassica napus]